MENKKSLAEYAKESLEQFNHLPEDSQKRRIINRIVVQLIEQSIKRKYTPEQFNTFLTNALQFVEELANSLYFGLLGSGAAEDDQWIWQHRNPLEALNYVKKNFNKVEFQNLNELISNYLKVPWLQSAALEKILVDAMIYQVAFNYGEQIEPKALESSFMTYLDSLSKPKPARIIPLFLITLKFLLKVSISLAVGLTAMNTYGWWAGLIAGFGFWILFKANAYFINNEAKKTIRRQSDLLNSLVSLSDMMDQAPISPAYIRERIISSANQGIFWPAEIFPILDKSIMRTPALWD